MSYDNLNGIGGIKLPPDSTGKSLMTGRYWEIQYTNLASGSSLEPGDYFRGQTSNTLAEVDMTYPGSDGNGTIIVNPEDSATNGLGFVVGENIRKGGVSNICTITAVKEHHVQGFQLRGQNNPAWAQYIDKDGSAYVRFTEGQQQLDAYGLSRMVQPKLLAAYNFKYDEEPEDFEKVVSGGGSISYDPVSSGIKLEVGSAAGDRAVYTSNVYYPVWPGCGQLITMVIACGDDGKDGLCVRWGYFNKDNGLFFERQGQELFVVQRSNITGEVVDQRIPQSSWNMNPVGSGTSDSSMTLDETKINVYWYNIHTLTGGRARYGVVDNDGFRITVHNEVDLNTSFLPTFRNISLPLRVEVENQSLTSSPSVVKFHAANVFSEGPTDEATTSAISRFSSGHLQYGAKSLTTDDELPIMSFRAGKLFKGVENRLVSIPIGFSMYCSAPVRVRLYKNTTLIGTPEVPVTWEPAGPYTPVQKEEKASAIDPGTGRTVHSAIYDAGAYNEDLDPNVWSPRGECMTIRGETGEFGDTYTCTMQKLIPGGDPVTVAFAGRWKDIG